MAHELNFLPPDLERTLEVVQPETALGSRSSRTTLERLIAQAFVSGTRLLTGANARWMGCVPKDQQRIYFANHTSHLDFILLWSVLPTVFRGTTRPVAARDYWQRNALRKHVSERVFRCVFVDRCHAHCDDSIAPLLEGLSKGDSLILFPEGTRGGGEALQSFRTGIFHLAQARPDVELVPVWMDNNYRVLPKGSFIPLPLLCSATFGTPTQIADGEGKRVFLERLRLQLEQLRTV